MAQVIDVKDVKSSVDGDGEENRRELSAYAKSQPEQRAGCLSKLLFAWLNPLLERGSKAPLKQEDIPLYPTTDDAYECYKKFDRLYQDAVTPEKLAEIKKKEDGKRPFGQIVRATTQFVGCRFFYATGLYQLIVVSFSPPILLNMLTQP